MDDFEKEIEQVLAFPGVGVQLAVLEKLRTAIEGQLEAARTGQLQEFLRRRAVTDQHPDDTDLEAFGVESMHVHYLPKAFRGGFLLMLWAAMESAIKAIANYAATRVGQPLDHKHFSRALFGPAAQALETRVGVKLFADEATREGLELLRHVRNALIHHDGNVDALPAKLRKLSGPRLQQLGLGVERDLHRQSLVPTEAFVEHQVRLVSNFLRRLDSAVFAALHPSSRFNE
jgi:hypothetical protein